VNAWTERGACREPGVDPELFFPVSESGPGTRQVAAARQFCARCPVTAQCLDWALRTGEPAGIWGGATTEERRHMRSAWRGNTASRSHSGLGGQDAEAAADPWSRTG
jgi:WhiB family transcriptional regulator, redox-sensing transcriptional regulator